MNFWRRIFANNLSKEFPEKFDDTNFFQIKNPLCSDIEVKCLTHLAGIKLHADPGLHGGGRHLPKCGGKLNPHLD